MQKVLIAAALFGAAALAGGLNRPVFKWRGPNGELKRGQLRAPTNGWAECDPGVRQYTGYFDIDATTNKHYWYWMFESKSNPSTDPVILWMTGGPGCSSALAMLAENGPCHINETTGALYKNPYSWNNAATIIYIDQPANVGFSYADASGLDHNETQVGDDMYRFMQAWLAYFPQFQHNDFFVVGESYGGHYAPATAHRIWQGNQRHEGPIKVPLKGLAVGNGLTDPTIQYKWYSHLAYEWCKTVKGAPCVSEGTYNSMKAQFPQCEKMITQCNTNNTGCSEAQAFCNNNIMGPYFESGLNPYDIRIPCQVPGLCYNFTQATNFMNRPDVQRALGVQGTILWQSCNMQVNGMFENDWMRDFNQYIPDLLNSEIRVMIYAGDVDFICNWLGNKAWATAQKGYPQAAAFAAAQDQPWWHEEMPAGRFRTVSSASNRMHMSFVQVHAAGHMVPMDQPSRALAMIKHFISDTPFFGFVGPL